MRRVGGVGGDRIADWLILMNLWMLWDIYVLPQYLVQYAVLSDSSSGSGIGGDGGDVMIEGTSYFFVSSWIPCIENWLRSDQRTDEHTLS